MDDISQQNNDSIKYNLSFSEVTEKVMPQVMPQVIPQVMPQVMLQVMPLEGDSTLADLIEKKSWKNAQSFLSDNSEDTVSNGVNYVDSDGFSVLASAIFNYAPFELIKQIVEKSDKKYIKLQDKYDSTPLHSACGNGLSREIIQLLADKCDFDTLTKLNQWQESPIDILLLQHGKVQNVEKVLILQNKLYEFDPNAEYIKQTTLDNLMKWTDQLPLKQKDRVLNGSLVKVVLNNKFLHTGCVAFLLTDIYVKALIIYIYSFILYEIINGRYGTTETLMLLSGCLYWTLSREIANISTIYLKSYITDLANWFDIAQIVFLGMVIRILCTFDGNLKNLDRLTFMGAISIAWFELIFAFGILVKSIAIFAVALIKIVGKLGPFLFTTIIFVAMYAHIFLIASAGDESMLCGSSDATLRDWSCDINASYVQVTSLLLTGDLAYSEASDGVEKLIPSYLFSAGMGILFLNISIAVITDAYNEAKNYESKAFTRNRLAFASGSQSVLSVVLFRKIFRNDIDETSQYRRKFKPEVERISFVLNKDLDWDSLKGDEKEVLAWWFNPWTFAKGSLLNKPPLLAVRLKVFFSKASFDEIFFPGRSFERVLMGVGQKNKLLAHQAIIARMASYLLFFVCLLTFFLVFCAGCLSFGILWPQSMKKVLLVEDVDDEDNQEQ